MKIKRAIVQIEEQKCNCCGKCIKFCVEGALRITDRKMHLVAEKFCDGCGACVGKCPLGALSIIERDADEYQELVYQKC
jgi:Na+-translocating ferredoxin:NAD+ oxidoreductase RNF subunit RnfB